MIYNHTPTIDFITESFQKTFGCTSTVGALFCLIVSMEIIDSSLILIKVALRLGYTMAWVGHKPVGLDTTGLDTFYVLQTEPSKSD